MRLSIEVELGNDAMQSRFDAFEAIRQALLVSAGAVTAPLEAGEGGKVYDQNGNSIGRWIVGEPDTSLRPRPGETPEQTLARVVEAVGRSPRFSEEAS